MTPPHLVPHRGAHPARNRHDQGGFTLIELIVSISILGVLMTALAAVMFSSLITDQRTGELLDSTRAQQFAATYLAGDVEGARASGGVVTSGTARCGTEPMVVEFRGDSFDPATPTSARITVVTYVQRDVTVNGVPARDLHRLSCEAPAGTATPLTPSADVTVARGLSTTAPVVTVTGTAVTAVLTPLNGPAFTLVGTRRTT